MNKQQLPSCRLCGSTDFAVEMLGGNNERSLCLGCNNVTFDVVPQKQNIKAPTTDEMLSMGFTMEELNDALSDTDDLLEDSSFKR